MYHGELGSESLVPFRIALERGFGLEECVKRTLFLAVYIDFVEQRECDIVVDRTEIQYFLVSTGFLLEELVAREPQDFQSLVFVFLIEGFKAFVLRGEPTLARHIDNQQHLAFIVGQ